MCGIFDIQLRKFTACEEFKAERVSKVQRSGGRQEVCSADHSRPLERGMHRKLATLIDTCDAHTQAHTDRGRGA